NANRPAAVPIPATEEDLQGTAMLVLRAMIEAAKADGQVDQAEMQRILRQLESAEADTAARHWVLEQLAKPADVAGLVAEVRSPEQAAQVYAAAVMAIEVDTPAERAFLDRLAAGLGLPPASTAHIRGALGLTA
ncbi:MAG: tellurite resistance TerB family protein, partial [Rubritepida sp.]|nr:tellurite resistance TerB family protein [Rubritepida sp.]